MSLALATLATAILETFPGDAVLVLPEGAALPAELATRIARDRLFPHTAAPPIWQPGRDPTAPAPICLGAIDADVAAPRPTQWPASLLPCRRRHRSCDTLYAGCPIRLMVLAAPADIAAILAGAPACLAHGQTIILLAVPAAAQPAATACLPAYRWQSVDTDLCCGLPPGLDFTPPPLPPPSPPAPIEIACDDALVSIGLHATEPGAPTGGRWTGAAMDTRLWLPRPPPGQWRLSFTVADWGNAPSGFDAAMNGQRLPPAGQTATGFAFAPRSIPVGGLALEVDLYPPLGARDLIRWPRRIGTRLLNLRLSPA